MVVLGDKSSSFLVDPLLSPSTTQDRRSSSVVDSRGFPSLSTSPLSPLFFRHKVPLFSLDKSEQ